MEKIEKTKCDYCDHKVTSFQSNLENLLCAKSKSCKICSFKIRTEKKQKLTNSQVGNLDKLLCVKSKSCEICSFKICNEKKQKLTKKIFIIN